nr:hypothetical protein CTI12_AA140520 [Tanacetum cinerariifolium]
MLDENILVTEKTDQNGVQVDMSPSESNARSLDRAPDSYVSAKAQESKSLNFVDKNIDQPEGASFITSHSASIEEMANHNFPSPFPPIETPPPLDQNENITYEKSNNGYEDMKSSNNELATRPSVNIKEVAERIVPQPPFNNEPSVNTKIEEVAERIVPQPPSDTKLSVNTEEGIERIVP